MNHDFIFLPPEWHDTLPSTNTELLERLRRGLSVPSGSVIAARIQTAGRGRQQRRWVAVPGRNLTFSFVWSRPVEASFLPSFAQALSVGIARYLESEGVRPTIKWPNDVQAGGRKVAGILCERAAGDADAPFVIVAGIGLNVNMTGEDAAAIDQPATSLLLETGRERDVTRVLDELLRHLERPLMAWANGGFGGIRDMYESYAPAPGTEIRVRDGASHVAGRLEGFTEHGALRLRREDGRVQVFYSGDVEL